MGGNDRSVHHPLAAGEWQYILGMSIDLKLMDHQLPVEHALRLRAMG